ncbi:MAG: hypothetical protein P8I38_08370 [Arenicella sp.]|jgi:hypothetical protein|nr:hypothetical protein [Arenicella sp.]HAU67416.1 hypothetical protein [Gammaproteobacteria bacterium]
MNQLFLQGLFTLLLCVATLAQAQWQVDENVLSNSTPSALATGVVELDAEATEALAKFEAAKCSNGGTEKRAFIDFSTKNSVEANYVGSVAQSFSTTLQLTGLTPELNELSSRSVRFLFELDRLGEVKSITVFAKESDTGLRQFVTELIRKTAPFPTYDSIVDECFESLVISAIFDF